jgi:hypothetical protein
MDEEWLLENFFTDDGFIRDFAHDVLLVRGSLARNAYRSRTIAKEMVAMPIPQGSVEELMRMLFKGEDGSLVLRRLDRSSGSSYREDQIR